MNLERYQYKYFLSAKNIHIVQTNRVHISMYNRGKLKPALPSIIPYTYILRSCTLDSLYHAYTVREAQKMAVLVP